MAKLTKKRKEALAKFEKDQQYPISEAVNIIKDITYTKFDASVDLNIRLGVDLRRPSHIIHRTVTLPHGTGKIMYTR